MVRWYWSAGPCFTAVNWSQHWCAICVQYQSNCAPKLARKCGIEHWFPCGADGRAAGGRAVYGHVITKFSGIGRFTYPWCSAGALRAPELRYKAWDAASSETQGQSVGSGGKAGRKFSSTGKEPLGTDSITELFPKIQAEAGSWLGTKNAFYNCAKSANSFSWVLFVSSYTTAIVWPHFHQACACKGNFNLFSTFLTRNKGTTDESKKMFGVLSAGAIREFAPRIFWFWRIRRYRK